MAAVRPGAPLLVFAVTVAVLLYLYSQVVQVSWFDGFLSAHAAVTGTALGLVGVQVDRVGTVLSNDRVAFTIISECTPVAAILIYAAGVLAFPASLRGKATGLAAGVVALTVVNILRIVSLFFVGLYLPSALDVFHLIVWQSLMVLLAVGLLLLWTGRVRRDVAA